MRQISASEEVFNKYEYLATKYASKLFNTHKIALERKDVEQEFRIKLYQIILAWGRSYQAFKEGNKAEPTEIIFYIKSSLSNFVKDFIKDIESKKANTIVVSQSDRDYAVASQDHSNLNLECASAATCEINGFDLLQGLNKEERTLFVLFLKGHSTEKLAKIFKTKGINAKSVIDKQKRFLRDNKDTFFPENKTEYFVTEYAEEV